MFSKMKDTFVSVREHLESAVHAIVDNTTKEIARLEHEFGAELATVGSEIMSMRTRLEVLETRLEEDLEESQNLLSARITALENRLGGVKDKAIQLITNPTQQTSFGSMPPQSGGPIIEVPLPAGTHEAPNTILVYNESTDSPSVIGN